MSNENKNGSYKFDNMTVHYKNNVLHREDGPAIEHVNGTKEWYVNGELHREDGPAIEFDGGQKRWFKNGKLHREDGPAVEFSHGQHEGLWYLNGKQCTEQEHSAATDRSKVATNIKSINSKLANGADNSSNTLKLK